MDADQMLGLDSFNAAVVTARTELLAAAPDAFTAAESDAYLARVISGCLSDTALAHLRTEGGLTRALQIRGCPNPDYVMWHAPINPSERYQLTGTLYESERVSVGLYAAGADGRLQLCGHVAVDHTPLADDGKFFVTLDANAKGANALMLTPTSRVLLIRVLHRRPHSRNCTLQLEGVKQLSVLNDGAIESQRSMAPAGQMALRSIRQFIRWSQIAQANPNQLIEPPPEIADEVKAEPSTTYGLGYFELTKNQSLEVMIPQSLKGYWSLHAYNHWGEWLPGASAHDMNTTPGANGRIRISVSPARRLEGSHHIDTLGRSRGILIFRAIGDRQALLPLVQLKHWKKAGP